MRSQSSARSQLGLADCQRRKKNTTSSVFSSSSTTRFIRTSASIAARRACRQHCAFLLHTASSAKGLVPDATRSTYGSTPATDPTLPSISPDAGLLEAAMEGGLFRPRSCTMASGPNSSQPIGERRWRDFPWMELELDRRDICSLIMAESCDVRTGRGGRGQKEEESAYRRD